MEQHLLYSQVMSSPDATGNPTSIKRETSAVSAASSSSFSGTSPLCNISAICEGSNARRSISTGGRSSSSSGAMAEFFLAGSMPSSASLSASTSPPAVPPPPSPAMHHRPSMCNNSAAGTHYQQRLGPSPFSVDSPSTTSSAGATAAAAAASAAVSSPVAAPPQQRQPHHHRLQQAHHMHQVRFHNVTQQRSGVGRINPQHQHQQQQHQRYQQQRVFSSSSSTPSLPSTPAVPSPVFSVSPAAYNNSQHVVMHQQYYQHQMDRAHARQQQHHHHQHQLQVPSSAQRPSHPNPHAVSPLAHHYSPPSLWHVNNNIASPTGGSIPYSQQQYLSTPHHNHQYQSNLFVSSVSASYLTPSPHGSSLAHGQMQPQRQTAWHCNQNDTCSNNNDDDDDDDGSERPSKYKTNITKQHCHTATSLPFEQKWQQQQQQQQQQPQEGFSSPSPQLGDVAAVGVAPSTPPQQQFELFDPRYAISAPLSLFTPRSVVVKTTLVRPVPVQPPLPTTYSSDETAAAHDDKKGQRWKNGQQPADADDDERTRRQLYLQQLARQRADSIRNSELMQQARQLAAGVAAERAQQEKVARARANKIAALRMREHDVARRLDDKENDTDIFLALREMKTVLRNQVIMNPARAAGLDQFVHLIR